MIFTALGLLLVAAGLLLAGIAKSSVALLMTSLLLTIGSGVVLTMALSAARRLTAATGGPAPSTGFVTPQGQPVVLYVQQAPAPDAAPAAIDLTDGASPFVGYDLLTAKQISELIARGELTDEQLAAVRDYEASHAARRTVLAQLS